MREAFKSHGPACKGPDLVLIEDLARQPEKVVMELDRIERMRRVNEHLKDYGITDEIRHIDKFKGTVRPYKVSEIKMPERIFVRGFDTEILDDTNLAVSFTGGLVNSHCVNPMVKALMRGISDHDSGTIIVSGGADGTDTISHKHAMDEKLRVILARPTILMNGDIERAMNGYGGSEESLGIFLRSIRGSGMGGRQSNSLVKSILAYGGAMFSEHDDFSTDFETYSRRLLARDRLVTGASDILVVIEGIERSGTIETAKKGIIQGKKVVVLDWEKVGDFKGKIDEYEGWKKDTGISPPGVGEPLSRLMEFEDEWSENFRHVPRLEGNNSILEKLGGKDRGIGIYNNVLRFPMHETSIRDIPGQFREFLALARSV